MKRYLMLVLLAVLLAACGGSNLPEGVIPQQKMESVLTDILLAESFAESYLSVDTTKKLKQYYDQELDRVLAIHKISQKQLMESIDFYKTHPEVFKSIMDTVSSRSAREKDKAYKESLGRRKK